MKMMREERDVRLCGQKIFRETFFTGSFSTHYNLFCTFIGLFMASVTDYTIVKKLGNGGFGTAYLVKQKSDGQELCMKEMTLPLDD